MVVVGRFGHELIADDQRLLERRHRLLDLVGRLERMAEPVERFGLDFPGRGIFRDGGQLDRPAKLQAGLEHPPFARQFRGDGQRLLRLAVIPAHLI